MFCTLIGGYKRVFLCQNPLNYTLKICAFQCMHILVPHIKNFNKKEKTHGYVIQCQGLGKAHPNECS